MLQNNFNWWVSHLKGNDKSFGVQHETIFVGDKKVSISTTLLEEKATAVNMLCCYADELKEGFYPYVAQVQFSSGHSFLVYINERQIYSQLSKPKLRSCLKLNALGRPVLG